MQGPKLEHDGVSFSPEWLEALSGSERDMLAGLGCMLKGFFYKDQELLEKVHDVDVTQECFKAVGSPWMMACFFVEWVKDGMTASGLEGTLKKLGCPKRARGKFLEQFEEERRELQEIWKECPR